MKKIIVTTLTIIMICFFIIILTGCDNETENNSNKSNSIIGEWKNDTTYAGYEFTYTFNGDGTGKYDAAGKIMPFTYKIDGNNISILYEGDTVSFDTTFGIDGDTLYVVDSMGEDTLYKKVK